MYPTSHTQSTDGGVRHIRDVLQLVLEGCHTLTDPSVLREDATMSRPTGPPRYRKVVRGRDIRSRRGSRA